MEWTDRLNALVEHLEFGLVQSGRWNTDYYLADGVVFSRLTEAEWRAVLRECRLDPRFGRAVCGEWSDTFVDPVEVTLPPDARLILAAPTTLGVLVDDGWCQLIETADGRLWPFDPRFWPWWRSGDLFLYEGPRGPMLVVRRGGGGLRLPDGPAAGLLGGGSGNLGHVTCTGTESGAASGSFGVRRRPWQLAL